MYIQTVTKRSHVRSFFTDGFFLQNLFAQGSGYRVLRKITILYVFLDAQTSTAAGNNP